MGRAAGTLKNGGRGKCSPTLDERPVVPKALLARLSSSPSDAGGGGPTGCGVPLLAPYAPSSLVCEALGVSPSASATPNLYTPCRTFTSSLAGV
jgi:hypothetical protein